jgi:hypothetical protein
LRGLLEPCPLLRRHGDHQTLQSPVPRRHGSKHAGRGCAGTSACLGLALAYTPASYCAPRMRREGVRQFLPALLRGYTDRYTQRYREGPTCRVGGPPAFPPRPPSAPLGGASPITASIHPLLVPTTLLHFRALIERVVSAPRVPGPKTAPVP